MSTLLAQQIVNGIASGSLYAILAVALALVFGVLEVPQFALGAHAMLGAFIMYYVAPSWGYWTGVAIAIGALIVIGLLVQGMVFDPLRNASGETLFIAAFGLLIAIQGVALVAFGPNNRQVAPAIEGGFVTLGVRISYQRLIIIVAVIAAIAMLNVVLKVTRVGRQIRAVGQSRTGAMVVGVSTRRIGFITMAAGSGLAGLVGGLLAPISQVYPSLGDSLVIKAFIIIIMAGMGSIKGALITGYIVGLTESLGAGYISAQFTDLYPIALLALVLIFRPQGLYGKAQARI